MISEHAILHHLYADDSQLYVSFAALTCVQACLASVQSWMPTNKLKLNPDKTEFLLIGSEWSRRKYLSMFPTELLGVKPNPAKSTRNLGVILDKNVTFRSYISTVCSSCLYYMQELRHIRHHHDLDSAKLLATTLVSRHLDFGNSLLYGITDIDLIMLKYAQNRVAHLITKSPPFTHSVPLLRSLHWLPVRFRILFQINLLTYKTQHEKQPVYLHFMLVASLPSRSLRSNNDNSLSVPRVMTNTGARIIHSLEQPPTVCLFSHFSCYLYETSEDTSLWLGLSSDRYRHATWPVDVTGCILDFSHEHWFSCRATESGFAGGIGATEVWLIDWLIPVLKGEGVMRCFICIISLLRSCSCMLRPTILFNFVWFSRRPKGFIGMQHSMQ